MKLDVFVEEKGAMKPLGMLAAARVGSMVLGLAVIPVLIEALGSDGFAAWAVLLAMAIAFTLLDVGMANTFIRFAAPLLQARDHREIGALVNHALAILLASFSLGALPAAWFAADVARGLGIPDGQWLSAGQLLLATYGAVALRALLQFGSLIFSAARLYRAFALASFLQSLLSNASAAVVAIWSGRLELVVLVFWLAQLLVLLASSTIALYRYSAGVGRSSPGYRRLRLLLGHGLRVQAYDFVQVITFQLDKLLIAAFTGLWAVAAYEISVRSVMALRSVPSSALDSFLASAALGEPGCADLWQRYQAVTQLAAVAALVFLVAPLVVAPAFLYAWTGEMGYAGRWVFVALALGASFSLLVLPAAAMVQAAGRADLQVRAAFLSLLLNIPLSLALVFRWEMAGVAFGTAIAMCAGSSLLFFEMHRAYRRPPSDTLAMLARLWPVLLVCIVAACLSHGLFAAWWETMPATTRGDWSSRAWPGVLAAAGYLACLVLMAGVQLHRGAFAEEHLDLLARLLPYAWFRDYRARRPGSG